jgi:hydroxyacylglutathione hydrolase
MNIEQLRVGADNFSYVISCPVTKKAVVIDPGFDITSCLRVISSDDLSLEYIILTHHHADHTAEMLHLKKIFSSSQIVTSEEDGKKLPIKPDVVIYDGEQMQIGTVQLEFLLTPGHTKGSICVLVDMKALLTGDTLFIGDCGRTDLPGGNLAEMFMTLQQKILPLPDELIIYPGHDYGEKPYDTLGNQKKTNKTLRAKTLQEFSMIS